MKKTLLFYALCLLTAFSNAQTYPVQDVDECVFMSTGFIQNSTYTASVANPVPADASTNVSSITPTSPGGTSTISVYYTLPYTIDAGTVIDFTGRFYTLTTGGNGVGSGRLRIGIQNNSLGGGSIAYLGIYDQVGGSWQTYSETGVTLTAGGTPSDTDINNAGGYDTLVIQKIGIASSETLYMDNIETSINPNLTVENADLDSGNIWIHNNRDGDNQVVPSSTFGASSVELAATTPATAGNSASNAYRYTKANSFSILQFGIPTISPPFSGTFKFRVFLDNCAPDIDNRMSIRLRSASGASTEFFNSGFVSITDKKWEEVSFDLSTLTATTSATEYTEIEIVVDQGDNAAKDGFIYYFDAIQGPFAGATTFTGASNNSFTVDTNWTNGVPNALFDATIQTGNNVGIFGTNSISVNNLTLEGDASLFLQATTSTNPELTVQGTVTFGTGDFNFRKQLATTNWS